MGLTIAFDGWTLTDYFASRQCHDKTYLIANFIAKAKSAVTSIASAFKAPAFAPALV